jgi:hypothetical protein
VSIRRSRSDLFRAYVDTRRSFGKIHEIVIRARDSLSCKSESLSGASHNRRDLRDVGARFITSFKAASTSYILKFFVTCETMYSPSFTLDLCLGSRRSSRDTSTQRKVPVLYGMRLAELMERLERAVRGDVFAAVRSI